MLILPHGDLTSNALTIVFWLRHVPKKFSKNGGRACTSYDPNGSHYSPIDFNLLAAVRVKPYEKNRENNTESEIHKILFSSSKFSKFYLL